MDTQTHSRKMILTVIKESTQSGCSIQFYDWISKCLLPSVHWHCSVQQTGEMMFTWRNLDQQWLTRAHRRYILFACNCLACNLVQISWKGSRVECVCVRVKLPSQQPNQLNAKIAQKRKAFIRSSSNFYPRPRACRLPSDIYINAATGISFAREGGKDIWPSKPQ